MTEKARQMRNAYAQEWRDKNRDHIREYHKKWRQANPDKVREATARYWERKANEKSSDI